MIKCGTCGLEIVACSIGCYGNKFNHKKGYFGTCAFANGEQINATWYYENKTPFIADPVPYTLSTRKSNDSDLNSIIKDYETIKNETYKPVPVPVATPVIVAIAFSPVGRKFKDFA